ncbi:hypothetical protein DIPPA_28140 [Diplonema papillatum]|nr:hypothetical protein DIPPA_28140 [Diplonema papillatum]
MSQADGEALVGKTWETDVTKADVDKIAATNRILVGNAMATMDFRPERLNVHVNEDTKMIDRVTWG